MRSKDYEFSVSHLPAFNMTFVIKDKMSGFDIPDFSKLFKQVLDVLYVTYPSFSIILLQGRIMDFFDR